MARTTLSLFSFFEQPLLERTDGLLRIFEDIHNHIYANDGLSPEQALEETVKILFLKIFDEKNKRFEFKITPLEYENIINGRSGTNFLKRFENLQQRAFSHFFDLFEEGEKIDLKNSTLGFVVSRLQKIDLLNSSNDVKGLAFQKFINSSQRTGRGQFFTPEQVVKLCVEIIHPRPDEIILDPACGSGSFLSSALQYVAVNQPTRAKKFARDNIYGIEINRTAAKIAKMRMILDGDGFSNITQCDSLADWNNVDFQLNKTSNRSAKTYRGFFDIILTNPPFGTQGKVTDKSILKSFDLGYKWDEFDSKFIRTRNILNGQVPEILFIERCLKFLKPQGRMAIILPNGDLENSSLAYLRNYIENTSEIFAVIKLPQETFIPSGTGVKTSILFLKKRNGKSSIKKVFFSQITKLGYLGNKNGSLIYKKDERGNILRHKSGECKIDEDISDVASSYFRFKNNSRFKDSETIFLINKSDLNVSRFDYEFYRPSCRKNQKVLLKNGAEKLGDLVTIKKSRSSKLKRKNLFVRYVELSDVSSQYNEIISATEQLVHQLPSRAAYELEKGEVITAVAGNSIGTDNHVSAYVTKEYDGCICTNGFRVFRIDEEKLTPFYLLYFLNSKYFLEQVYRFRTGAAIPSLSDVDLSDILILLPNMKKQKKIGEIIENGFNQRKRYRDQIRKINFSFPLGVR